MLNFITHAACFVAGSILGIVTMCLMVAAGRADEQLERLEQDWRDDE